MGWLFDHLSYIEVLCLLFGLKKIICACWYLDFFCLNPMAYKRKGSLKLPNLHMLTKQESLLLPRNLAVVTFGKLLIVFSTKVNLLYLLYSMAWRCFLHLIKQNCFLKTFLRTLILMTQVSLNLFSLLEPNWNCMIFLKLPKWLKRS